MREFASLGGGGVIIDGDKIKIKAGPFKEECSWADIIDYNLKLKEEKMKGSFEIKTTKRTYYHSFNYGYNDFRYLYNILCEKCNPYKVKINISELPENYNKDGLFISAKNAKIAKFILIALFIIITFFLVSILSKPWGQALSQLLGVIYVLYSLFTYALILSISRNSKLAKLPALTSPAVLIEKILEHRRAHSLHFLVFELNDGSRKLFKVNRDIYAKISEKETGMLTYKEKGKLLELLNFKKAEHRS